MTDDKPQPPGGLQERGLRFWNETVSDYELTESELALLTEACRTIDNLDNLADAIAAEGVMVTGSAGQPVIHPGLTEARGQRVVLHRLLAALSLPDPDGQSVTTATTTRARTAAKARWGRAASLKVL